ncbi:MBL fold metallo-hydrolase [Streptomyces sp. UNOB3_S3]|uniref:MBL fold metallo-hydrolase n=1 Tax=Streptomyces sp. UNOB3_S3 TaxID=2871682 RepID=UPI001E4D9AA6|nr:MBL fold metallo-hydrolase [Streptomyces sp. UNOB3_S3]MCC3775576.1 MBL fold metallo-hydrolase [Streptomyces sp. UNOB3_S3]
MQTQGDSGAAPTGGTHWERLAPGVVRRRLPGWDATVGAIAGTDGVLVVDTGSSLHEGVEIRREAQELFGLPVTHIALTHPHFDHVLGTAAFSGVQVYAAVGAAELMAREREELRHDAVRHGMDPDTAAEAVDLLVLPHHPVSGELTVDLGGGRRVLLANIGPGHTAHDLAVLVAGEREIVFCGDVVEESGEPQAGPDALPHAWPAALDRLLTLGGDDAVYVPGHGAVVDAAFVRAQRDALAERFGMSGS